MMTSLQEQKNNRAIATWLLIGVGMIAIQVLLGGITRLTESGLSITEWKPITGALPPLNDAAWQTEFDKYRGTDQFKYVHAYFSLSDFKFIFFWEWFHRLWARLMGLVFLTGFVYFLARRRFNKELILPMAILFLLGGVQGAIGWIMVQSGLVPEKYFVGHVELATHFIAALVLLAYTWWFALSLLPSFQPKLIQSSLQKFLRIILVLLLVQLTYGAFMAGMKAAVTAPTWPSINGQLIPSTLTEQTPWFHNLWNNPLTIHFIHRGIGYLLTILIAIFYFRSSEYKTHPVLATGRKVLLGLVLLQITLGIFTLLYATQPAIFVWLGVLHQCTAMLLVLSLIALLFVVRGKGNVSKAATA